MKIVTYEVENKTKLGIFSADGQWVYPLECFGMEYQEMQENAYEYVLEHYDWDVILERFRVIIENVIEGRT